MLTMKKINYINPKSNCCKAAVIKVWKGYKFSHYICEACHKKTKLK